MIEGKLPHKVKYIQNNGKVGMRTPTTKKKRIKNKFQ